MGDPSLEKLFHDDDRYTREKVQSNFTLLLILFLLTYHWPSPQAKGPRKGREETEGRIESNNLIYPQRASGFTVKYLH